MTSNRGVVYVGPGRVEVRSIDFPKLVDPLGKRADHGVILKVVSTNICGSDQHMVRAKGLWYARSPETVHSGVMETLVWLRVPGDIVFAVGGLCLGAYAWRLLVQRRKSAIRTGVLPI